MSSSLSLWRREQGRHLWRKWRTRHEPTFCCSSLVESELAWQRPDEVKGETKEYSFRINIDGTTKRSLQKEILAHCLCFHAAYVLTSCTLSKRLFYPTLRRKLASKHSKCEHISIRRLRIVVLLISMQQKYFCCCCCLLKILTALDAASLVRFFSWHSMASSGNFFVNTTMSHRCVSVLEIVQVTSREKSSVQRQRLQNISRGRRVLHSR